MSDSKGEHLPLQLIYLGQRDGSILFTSLTENQDHVFSQFRAFEATVGDFLGLKSLPTTKLIRQVVLDQAKAAREEEKPPLRRLVITLIDPQTTYTRQIAYMLGQLLVSLELDNGGVAMPGSIVLPIALPLKITEAEQKRIESWIGDDIFAEEQEEVKGAHGDVIAWLKSVLCCFAAIRFDRQVPTWEGNQLPVASVGGYVLDDIPADVSAICMPQTGRD
jgi:hypothetical protein